MTNALLVAAIVAALVFDFTNGFHDTANAIATSISTRALSPRIAVLMSAVFNLVGALVTVIFFGSAVSNTIAKVLAQPTAGGNRVEPGHRVRRTAKQLDPRLRGRPGRCRDRRRGGLQRGALERGGKGGDLAGPVASDRVSG